MAFICSAAIGVIPSLAGLFCVQRVSFTAKHVADVTSPLLTASMNLFDAAQGARATLLLALEKDPEHAPDLFSSLHADMRSRIDTLKSLAARAEIDVRLGAIEEREQRFAEAARSLMNASQRRRKAIASRAEKLGHIARLGQTLRLSLASLAAAGEGEMTKSEEAAKVLVQTGRATTSDLGDSFSQVMTDIYPIVQGANRLLWDLDQLSDRVQLMVARSDQAATNPDYDDAGQIFQRMDAQARKIAGRLSEPNREAEFKIVRAQMVELRSLVDGVVADIRLANATESEIESARRALETIQNEYFGVLADADQVIRRVGEQAQRRMAEELKRARYAAVAAVFVTLLAASAFWLFVTRRLSDPLRRLADHVQKIRLNGDLTPLPLRLADHRPIDEIEALACSFNLMLGELAEARRRLIASSEAEIRTQYERLDLAINSIPQGLCMFDSEQRLIVCNERYKEMYELLPELTVPGAPLSEILAYRRARSDIGSLHPERLPPAGQKGAWYCVDELRNGRAVAISYLPLSNGGSISTHEDITERRKVEAQIEHMAHHDSLTELPNRVSFRNEMDRALALGRNSNVAVFCLDLDRFKNVNDTLGHPVGDELLKAVAARLRACLRPPDCVARLGGDEFAIIQVAAHQPGAATALAERIIKELTEPFELQQHQIVVGASVGISLASTDGWEADDLLKNADMALYRAKADGRGVYRFFEPEMDVDMQARRALEMSLRNAISRQEFELHYQPLVNLSTDEISSCEALVRWRHGERGLVPPNEFIPLAEEIGLINQIGAWVLKEACSAAMQWPSGVGVAVNLSPVQFKAKTLILDVISALGASGLSPPRLELEITETVLLNDTESTISTLNQLRELGVRIAMDDFGTGYSSLGYLRKFRFDKIKIDRSFVQDLSQRPDSVAIIRAITSLGHSLGISTTAEGVENEAQLRRLREERCTEAQGYLLGKPQTAADIMRLLATGVSRLAAAG